jgi:hypothetical protein
METHLYFYAIRVLKTALGIVAGCLLVFATLAAENVKPPSAPLPEPVYFQKDWCPLALERQAISAHFKLTMVGCCIFRAERIDQAKSAAADAIQPFLSHMAPDQDLSWCRGDNSELKRERDNQAAATESDRMKQAAVERQELPAILRRLDLPMLCEATGTLIRGESWLVVAPNLREAAWPLVKAELRQRVNSVNEERVKRQQIQTGDTECHLYAALGLPQSSNRSTTARDISVQHVYRGSRNYVYTRNGRITSWQD